MVTKWRGQAQYNLGRIYESGYGVKTSHEEAVKWYRLAANQGHACAQYRLGTMYEYGRGVEQSYEEAIKWYKLAADQGQIEAKERLDSIVRN
ncbi:tetratricopeptide repeat protein [Candidatus Methanarcanum hacksteinii]|uniref:tetratricopeptide repeat protein n=1 Tax=Candidatus Methanarcanum hacksteinii TaxID=2911857 RepID=UPI0037DCA9AC